MSYDRYDPFRGANTGRGHHRGEPGGHHHQDQYGGSAWSQQSQFGNGNGGPSGSNPEMQQLLSQVRQLQQKVLELSGGGGVQGGGDDFVVGDSRPIIARGSAKVPLEPNGQRRILLVSNLPMSLATCDSVYFMFERFGTVERVKMLHNKRNTALVQMETPSMAEQAVEQQQVLNKTGTDIFVNFSTNVSLVRMPSEVGLNDDGLSRDYTGQMPEVDQSNSRYSRSLLGVPPQMGGGGGGDMSNQGAATNGPCLLVSSLPDELANPDSICNLFGIYGDVTRVKILRNKRDCALLQLSKPHQATLCRNFLDQARIGGRKICVSFSRMSSIKLPADIGIDDDPSTKDYSNVRGVHRFRNPNIAHKLLKNLCAPTPLLHVANMPDGFGKDKLRQYFVDNGFTVKDIQDCGKDGSMALVHLSSVEEAIGALAKLHNKTPEDFSTKNNSGLCFSFSNRRIQET